MWTGTENKVELYLIRHGYTRANEEHLYLGRTDMGLSERGKRELLVVEKTLRDKRKNCEFFFTGPMKRCRESADLLFGDVEKIVIPQWTEMDFGLFECKGYKELSKDPRYQAWIDSGGTMAFPEGESREDFIDRSCEGLEILMEYIHGKSAMALLHGGNIMAIMSKYGDGNYYDYQVKPGKGYRCVFETGDEIKLVETEEL